MRKVLIKQYDGAWTYAPDLDKRPAVRAKDQKLSSNHLETLARNISGSINSYLILEVLEEKNNLKVVFPLISIKNWDYFIKEAMEIFIQLFSKKPQVVMMNKKTLDQVEKILGLSLIVRLDEAMADQDFALVHEEHQLP